MFNQEIKGNLARLLATENLVVEHRRVSTACFDVVRRVLTLPLWDRASSTVYDLLVGHEVGHALFTPSDNWDFNVPKDFINVVEDARIEKLMKRKYAGLSKDFYKGYQELNDDDFFDIKGQDLSKFNLIDRINLHFKIGAYACIPFNNREKVFVDKVEKVETFEEVIDICREIQEFLKENKEDTPLAEVSAGSNQGTGSPQAQSTSNNANGNANEEGNANEDSPVGDSDDGDIIEGSEETAGNKGGFSAEDVSRTQKAFDSAAEDLNDQDQYSQEPVYVEVPEVDINKIIVDHDDLLPYIKNFYDQLSANRQDYWGDIFSIPDSEFHSFKKSAQKEVNYLVKEFECRKSADAYARAGQSKTGVLDTSKLHTYKYNDDVFKRVTILPDGKNHGMIFILDWSGSMTNILMDTVKQLLNLCWFCKKVQIPFEVYAFTYEWSNQLLDQECDYNGEWSYTRKHNTLSVHKRFSLLNLVTSRSNSKDFDQSIRNLWRLAYYYKNSCYYSNPVGLDLSGTPLNESLITLKSLIPVFQKQNSLQKVNVCILTDGESNNISYDVDMNIDRGYDHMGQRSVGHNCCLRDRKNGRTYRHVGYGQEDSITTILLENLKDSFPNVNFIGFRIGTGSDFSSLYHAAYGWKDHESVMKQWRKNKTWEINGLGYDSLYVMAQSTLSSDTEFEVQNGANKTEITKAFRSMLKNKTTNKKILTSLATVIS
ncbi:MAG: hypothetical protein ACO3CD_05935 [Candidatus Nanopelagicaceae bacterium]